MRTGFQLVSAGRRLRWFPVVTVLWLTGFSVAVGPSETAAAATDAGWAALWRNDIATARTEFQRALDEDGNDLWARRGLVLTCLARGYERDIIDELEELSGKDEADAFDFLLAMWVYKSIATNGEDEKVFLKICEKLAENDKIDPLDRRPIWEAVSWFALSTGDAGKVEKVGKRLHRIDKWSILGPFDNTSGSGHARAHFDYGSIDKNESFTGKAGQKFTWHDLEILSLSRSINFENHFERSHAITAYAACEFTCKDAGPYLLSISNQGSLVAFVDGEEILDIEDVKTQDEFHHIEIKARPGRHVLLIKVSGDERSPVVAASLSNPDGDEPKDIDFEYPGARPGSGLEASKPHPMPVIAAVDAMLGTDLEDARANFWKLLTLWYFDLDEEAREFGDKLAERFPDSGILLGAAGKLLFDADDEAAGRQCMLNSVKADPSMVKGLEWQAADKIKRKMYVQSDSLLNKAASMSSQAITAKMMLLGSYSERDLADKAMRLAEELVDECPDFSLPHEILAQHYEAIGERGKAKHHRRAALRSMPKSYMMLKKVTEALKEEDPGDAAKQWENLLELMPDSPDIYVYLADSKIRDGDAERGISLAKTGARLFPYCWMTQRYAGHLEQLMSTYDSARRQFAVQYLTRAVSLRPGDFETRDLLREVRQLPPLRDSLPKIALENARSQAPDATEYPGEDACVLLDEHRRIVFADGTNYVEHALVAKVFNDAGVDAFSTYSTGLNPFFADIDFKSARTLKPDGREFEAETVLGEVAFQSLAPGDIIELHYGERSWNAGKLNIEFWDTHGFQWSYPCLYSAYSLFVPPERNFSYELHNELEDNKVHQSEESVSSFKHHRWVMRDIPPVNKEYFAPPVSEICVWLDVSSVGGWADIADWYRDLSEQPSREDRRVAAKTLELTKDAQSDEEKLRILYDYVSNNITYRDITFSKSGLIPQRAADVLRSQQGDCKDKVCLLRSMLASAGIESYFALVSPIDEGTTPVLPSPRFSHAVLAVRDGNGYTYYDPTAKGIPSTCLPSFLQGANALVVHPETSALTPIPFARSTGECIDIATQIVVTPEDQFQLHRCETTRVGDRIAALRSELARADREKRRRYLTAALSASLIGFHLDEFEWRGLDSTSDSVTVTYDIKIDKALKDVGQSMKIGNIPWRSVVQRDFGVLVSQPERRSPLALYGLRVNESETVQVTLPQGWRIKTPPESREFTCPYGVGIFSYEMKGNDLYATRKLTINGLVVPPENYSSFREFLEGVLHEQEEVIVMERR